MKRWNEEGKKLRDIVDSFRIVNAQIIKILELEKRICNKKLIGKKKIY